MPHRFQSDFVAPQVRLPRFQRDKVLWFGYRAGFLSTNNAIHQDTLNIEADGVQMLANLSGVWRSMLVSDCFWKVISRHVTFGGLGVISNDWRWMFDACQGDDWHMHWSSPWRTTIAMSFPHLSTFPILSNGKNRSTTPLASQKKHRAVAGVILHPSGRWVSLGLGVMVKSSLDWGYHKGYWNVRKPPKSAPKTSIYFIR